MFASILCKSHKYFSSELFVPSFPNIYDLRELVMSPYIRSQYETETVATVFVEVFCAFSGFENHGVIFTESANKIVR